MNTLDSIVKEYLIEIGDTQLNKYARIYTIAVSGLREFNMDTTGVPKVVDLCISDIDTVDIPFDCIRPTRIAICGRDGLLHSLGEDNSICLGTSFNDCGIPTRSSGTLYAGQSFLGTPNFTAEHYRNGEVMGRFFGIGGGNNTNGTYRFDLAKGQIQLGHRHHQATNIVLEYLSDINTIGDDFPVHPFMINALKDYIYWKYIQRDSNKNAGEKQLAERAYEKSERIARIRFSSRTSTDWLMAIRTSNKSAVKW